MAHQRVRAQSKPKVAAGLSSAMALRPDGTVWAWGFNERGVLGDGTTTHHYTPARVSGLPDAGTSVESIGAGAYYGLALLSDGTVRAWGENYRGQLGDGTTSSRYLPVKVLKDPVTKEPLSGVVALAAGYDHTLALDANGMLWAWGENVYGQLGDGSTLARKIPKPVLKDPATGEALSGVVGIAAGKNHSVALLSDGTVWTWGYNNNGQLGTNSTVNTSVPQQVQGISGAVEVGAGEFFSQAVLSDGTVRNWGDNTYTGQLGDGSTLDQHTPVAVSNLGGVAFVTGSRSTGGHFGIAVKTDGSVWAWGDNQLGQLGDGLSTCTYLRPWNPNPVPVLLSQVQSVSAGTAFALAQRTDGTVWFWGNNTAGVEGSGRSGGCANAPRQVVFPSP